MAALNVQQVLTLGTTAHVISTAHVIFYQIAFLWTLVIQVGNIWDRTLVMFDEFSGIMVGISSQFLVELVVSVVIFAGFTAVWANYEAIFAKILGQSFASDITTITLNSQNIRTNYQLSYASSL